MTRGRDRCQQDTEGPQVESIWGDFCDEKEVNYMRIGALNIGTFPGHKTSTKLHKLHEFIDRHEFDIIGFQEVNTNWQKRDSGTQMEELIYGWFTRMRMNTAYYKGYPSQISHQQGGVSQWAIGGMADRATERGEDTTGLGRWTWQRLQGKQGRFLRVVTAYRPVVNKEGMRSVWSQQRAYWIEKGVHCCPRQRFTEDLLVCLQEWVDAGDQIVLLMDANEDVREGELADKLAEVGLTDLIMGRHGREGPPTFQLGSHPIDGIFGTVGLQGCKCGYLQSMSDHLGLWIDIPYDLAFGPGSKPCVLAGGRRLHCKDPRIVERYSKALKPMLENQNILARTEFLYNNRRSLSQEWVEREWNKIDKERVKIMLAAEKKCRRLRKGAIQWTPEYAVLTATLKAWTLIAAKRRRRRIDTRYFTRVLKRANLLQQAGANLEIAERAIKETRTEIKAYAKRSTEKRLNWLEGLAEAIALEELAEEDVESREGAAKLDRRQRTIVKQLIAREEQRRSARVIRRTWQGLQERTGITQVIGPNAEGGRTTFTEQAQVEDALLDENKGRFNQSRDTAFMQPPICNLVDPMGFNDFAQQILDGTAQVPEEADEFAKLLINHMKRAEGAQPMDIRLDVEDYRTGWRSMRESTASGISGIHFGHFKAHEKDILLAALDAVLAQIPFEQGFSPERWRKGIEVMLLKLPGNYNVEKMRAILLFEADFNFNNKRWGRILMWYAEARNLLAAEQYGSRKRLAAIDHCVNKRLTFDILRQNKQPGVLCSNDAKGCYDRIVHSVASICLQRLGMPRGPLKSMFSTLQNLQHFVRSSFGISEKSFHASEVNDIAIQGIGQGNGAGPQIWAAVSTVLLNALRSTGAGGHFTTAITGREFDFVGYAFVDDTDLIATNRLGTNSDATLNSMQEALRVWEGCLRASGGAIEPAKTFWYGIDFAWDKGNWKYQEEWDRTLEVRNPGGTMEILEQVDVSEARRTLGVRLAPDGNDREQAKVMVSVIRQWAEGLRTNNLPRNYAWLSYKTTLWPKIRYALPATNIPSILCERMDKDIRRALLPAMGINRNFPKLLTHGAVKYGGLGIPRVEEEQGIAAIGQLVRYINDPDSMTGKLLQASLETMQVETGVDIPVLQADWNKFGHLATKCYVKSIWEFCSKAGITMQANLPILPRLRGGDKQLITSFQERFNKKQLARLNKCRLAVRATTWADVVTIDGKRILGRAWRGMMVFTREKVKWPNQGDPTKQDWNLWRKALATVVAQVDETQWRSMARSQQGPTLRQPLGSWNHDFKTGWEVLWSTGRLYHEPTKTQYLILPQRQTRTTQVTFDSPSRYNNLPRYTQPAKVKIEADTAKVLGWGLRSQPPEEIPNQDIREFFTTTDEANKWMWTNMEWSDNGDTLEDAIRSRKAIVVSDGTLKEGKGAASAVVEGRTAEGRIRLDCLTSGDNDQQSSFRSELTGILMAVSFVQRFCERKGITSGKVVVGCDGEAALQVARKHKLKLHPNAKHTDLSEELRGIIRESNIDWRFKHIKGHTKERPFTRHAELNDEMDTACKNFLDGREPILHQEAKLTREKISIWVGQRKIVSNLSTELTEMFQTARAKQYWIEKQQDRQGQIDWQAYGKARSTSTRQRQVWLSKQSSSFCGCGKMMLRMGKWETDECPRCAESEGAEHIWTCGASEVDTIWSAMETKLREVAEKFKTPPGIVEAMIEGIVWWRRGESETASSTQAAIQGALTDQERIGWRAFCEGRWSGSWQQAYKNLGGPKDGTRWAAALIHVVWDAGWNLWTQRNEAVHKRDNNTAWERIDTQIRELKEAQVTGLEPLERNLYNVPTTRILGWDPGKRLDWLTRIKAAIKGRDKRQQQNPMEGMRRVMANFLQRRTTNNNASAPTREESP
jgi:hypothetical protein